jgi:hypothetical protein
MKIVNTINKLWAENEILELTTFYSAGTYQQKNKIVTERQLVITENTVSSKYLHSSEYAVYKQKIHLEV